MRQYLTGFWLERSQSETEALILHQDYMARIEHVDEQYGDCKKGQGSLTEMGNISSIWHAQYHCETSP